jgi:hypothetical protein
MSEALDSIPTQHGAVEREYEGWRCSPMTEHEQGPGFDSRHCKKVKSDGTAMDRRGYNKTQDGESEAKKLSQKGRSY